MITCVKCCFQLKICWILQYTIAELLFLLKGLVSSVPPYLTGIPIQLAEFEHLYCYTKNHSKKLTKLHRWPYSVISSLSNAIFKFLIANRLLSMSVFSLPNLSSACFFSTSVNSLLLFIPLVLLLLLLPKIINF